MNKDYKMYKNWYKLAKPSKKNIFFQFSTVLLRYVFLLISPIYAARAISDLSVANYSGAVRNLTIDIIFIILSVISFTINYYMTNRLIQPIYVKLQGQVLDKILDASDTNFKKMSKEKLINIIGNDTYIVGSFADVLAGRLARFARVIVTVIVIFIINPLIGVVAILLNVLNYFILNGIYEKMSLYTKRIKESNDRLFVEFSQYMDSKDTINTLNIRKKVQENFKNCAVDYCKEKHLNTIYQSRIDNSFFAYYKIAIYAISLLMIFLISKGTFDLTTYLILVPYLLSSVEISNEAYQLLPKLKEANISANRIKAILNFTSTRKVSVGENMEDVINGVLNFENVSYKGTKANPRIQNIDLHIRQNQTTLFLGERQSGKRSIFRILNREIRPSGGKVFLSGQDIFNYSKEAYSSNVNYITTTPFIYKGSIMRNFKMVEAGSKKIYEICDLLGISSFIEALPQRYATDSEKLTYAQKYLLSLARAMLTDCEVLILYEIPTNVTKREKDTIFKAIKKINGYLTIIIFSALDDSAALANKIVKIEDGKITDIYFGDVQKF